MVPEEGVEPSRPEGHGILSPARLPVSPLRPGGERSFYAHWARKRDAADEYRALEAKARVLTGTRAWRRHTGDSSEAGDWHRIGPWTFSVAGRGASAAGAMRSAPPHCEAGKRAQRFVAATSRRVIRVPRTTTGASVRLTDVGQPHPLVAAGSGRVRAASAFPARGAAPAAEAPRPAAGVHGHRSYPAPRRTGDRAMS